MLNKSIIFPNGTKLNFHGTQNLMDYVDLSFPYISDYKVDRIKNEVNIIYDGQLNDTVKVPNSAEKIKGFAGPNYFVWNEKDGITFSYSPIDERRGAHLIRNNGSDFVVRIHESETEDILCRISRDIILKDIIEDNFFPVHAAVVKNGSKAEIFFGKKGSGKSTALFSSIIFGNSIPMSGDIAFVRQSKAEGWEVLGWPWRVTIDSNYFNLINQKIDSKYEERGKLRFLPYEFCQKFNTKWAWHAQIGNIVKTDLQINRPPYLQNLTSIELRCYLDKEGSDDWSWNDSFKIGIKKPTLLFNTLALNVSGSIISGDIIRYYREKELFYQKIYQWLQKC